MVIEIRRNLPLFDKDEQELPVFPADPTRRK
jgi:hypothetical protein